MSAIPAFVLGGLVFAFLGGRASMPDPRPHLQRIAATFVFVPGFEIELASPAQLVVENAFDEEHFGPVHGARAGTRFQPRRRASGDPFVVDGSLVVPPSVWQQGCDALIDVPYTAFGYGPGLVITEMGGDDPYVVVTSALPLGEHRCRAAVSVLVPRTVASDATRLKYLLEMSRQGLRLDEEIWRTLDPAINNRDEAEGSASGFAKACQMWARTDRADFRG